MEKIRNLLIKEYEERISVLELCIQNDNNTLDKIKAQGENEYVKHQIQKNQIQLAERTNEIRELKLKIQETLNGKFDKEIRDNMELNKNKIREQNQALIIKKKKIMEEKKEKSEKSKQLYKHNKKIDREQKYREKNMNRCANHFFKTEIPNFMKKKLIKMPNNKGYKWKDIIFWGELPKEKNNSYVVFEKNYDLLIIHEWTPTHYYIYHKNKNDKKKLYSSTPRKKIQ